MAGMKAGLAMVILVAMVAMAVADSAQQCNVNANVIRLAACQAAAINPPKNPKSLANCCQTVASFGTSPAGASCLCSSMIAAQKLNSKVDLHLAVAIPAKCQVAVPANTVCNGIKVPQH